LSLARAMAEDHPPLRGPPLLAQEHVLRAAQPDPLGAPLDGVGRLAGGVGIGPHLEPPDLISPAHEALIGLPDLLLAGLGGARPGAARAASRPAPAARHTPCR